MINMATYREEEDPFEEDIVFDQAGLLNSTSKMNTAIRRVSSGKCVLFAKTLGLCGAFFGLGLCIGIPGPTFLSPLTELDAKLSPISNIYVARSSGYLIGSIIGGMLFDRFNRLFLLFVSLLLMAVFITITPWCQAWILEVCMVVLGVAMGFLDTGGNVLCLDLWGRNSGPFMQALHFSFGLGAFVAPLLAAPFLEPTPFNSTALSFDVSSAITEFPVHILSPKASSFELNIRDRTRRNADVFLNGVPGITEEVKNVSSSIPWTSTQKSYENQSTGVLENSSIAMTVDKPMIASTIVPVQNSTVRQKFPKRKPSKIDGSKLGNWDKLPFGKPPPADLLPPTTSTTTTTTTTTTPIPSTNLTSTLPLLISTSDIADNTTTVEDDSETTSPRSYSEMDDSSTDGPSKSTFASSTESSTEYQDITSSLVKPVTTTGSSVLTGDPFYFTATSEIESVTKLSDSINSPTEITTMQLTLPPSHSLSPILPSFSQMKDNSLSLSSLNSVSTTQSYIPFVDSNQAQNKTETLQQSMQNSYVTKENNLAHKELFYQSSEREENLDSSSEIATSFSNIVPPSLSEQIIKENIISALNISKSNPIELPNSTTAPFPKHVHRKPGTFDNDTEHINTIFDIFANRIEKYGFNKIQFSYLIVGIFVFLISLVFLGFLCHNPRDPKSKQEEGQGGKKITNTFLHITLISLMALFFFLYVGMEVTYGQLVLAFAMHSNLQLAQSTGSVISIVFWGSFAAMRFASIFFASGFSPTTMLVLNFTFCTTGTILVSVLANYVETALWVGTALIGIGLASMFPTGILWIERYIHVSNKVAAIFVIGVSLGQMICPVTIYRLMLNDPTKLMHSTLVFNVVCIATFAVSWWLASRQGEKYSAVNNNGYQLANQHDEEEDMMDMSPSASGSAAALRRHSFSSEHRALLNGNLHRGP